MSAGNRTSSTSAHGDPRGGFGSTPVHEAEPSGASKGAGLEEEEGRPARRSRKSGAGPKHTRRTVAALSSSVDVFRDAQGIPRIQARSLRDAYGAIGFCMAEDRLEEMDLLRRMASGRAAEVLGSKAVRHDAIVRTAGIPRRAAVASSRVDGPAREVLAAFAGGVNAARALRGSGDASNVAPWTVADSLAIELHFSWRLASDRWAAKLYAAIALCEKASWLAGTLIAPSPVPPLSDERSSLWARLDPRLAEFVAGQGETGVPGGFVCALGGERTTGLPILGASLELPAGAGPGAYTVVMEVGGEPTTGCLPLGTPLLLAGRNRAMAWAFTGLPIDDADLVMEELDGIGSFRSSQGWEKVQVRREIIRVRDGDAVRCEVAETRNGPLLTHLVEQFDGRIDDRRPLPIALRWGINSLSSALPGLLALQVAGSIEETAQVSAALSTSPTPLEGLVALNDGSVSRMVAGSKPRRDGRAVLPVRGWLDEARWEGSEPPEDLSETPAGTIPGVAWLGGGVADSLWEQALSARLGDLLAGAGSVDELESALSDRHDLVAAEVRSLMIAGAVGGEEAAANLLRDWDGSMNADSGAAALFWVALSVAVKRMLPRNRFGPLASHPRLGLRALLGRIGADPSAFPQGVLAEALDEMERLSGADPGRWQWGAIHRLRRHPLDLSVETTYMPVSGSPGTIEGYRLSELSWPFEANVEPAVVVLSDLASSLLEIVDFRGRVRLDLGARPDAERVELVPG
jgi:penicillin amidase